MPSPTELELAVIPGDEPGSAIRVRVEPGRDGYARLELLAFSEDLGWYTQKSFCIPAAMVRDVISQLRKADCFLPRDRAAEHDAPIAFPGLQPAPHADQPNQAQRREA